jgi:hypothetical protein
MRLRSFITSGHVSICQQIYACTVSPITFPTPTQDNTIEGIQLRMGSGTLALQVLAIRTKQGVSLLILEQYKNMFYYDALLGAHLKAIALSHDGHERLHLRGHVVLDEPKLDPGLGMPKHRQHHYFLKAFIHVTTCDCENVDYLSFRCIMLCRLKPAPFTLCDFMRLHIIHSRTVLT